jgi:hypothetical protein
MNEQDTQLNNLFRKAKNVSLKSEEKAALRASLAAFMYRTPVDEKTKIAIAQPSPLVMNPRSARLYKANSKMTFALFSKQKKTNMIIALLLAFGLTAGTSFAAQNTLPGDTLYPVKIHINEEVESFVAVGARADAEVKAKHALKRLEEAGKLNAAGRLTVEHKSEVEHRFKEHVKDMDDDLRELRTQGDADTEMRVRGEFNKKAAQHRKDLLVVHVDGTADVEHSIDLDDLLDEQKEVEEDDRSGRGRGTSSTTFRVSDDNEEHREIRREDRETEDSEEREVEIHTDTEASVSLPQLIPNLTNL